MKSIYNLILTIRKRTTSSGENLTPLNLLSQDTLLDSTIVAEDQQQIQRTGLITEEDAKS